MGRRDLGAGQEQLLQGSGSDASRIQAHEQHGIAAAALGEGLGAGAAMDLGSGARRDWPEGGGFGHANGGEEPISACGRRVISLRTALLACRDDDPAVLSILLISLPNQHFC